MNLERVANSSFSTLTAGVVFLVLAACNAPIPAGSTATTTAPPDVSSIASLPLASGADIILYNGQIVTVDKDFSIHEAISVKDGKIMCLGKQEDVEKCKGDATQVVDLQGKTVLPGFIDNHNHLLWSAVGALGVDLSKVRSIEELKAKIREAAASVPEEHVIHTSSDWHESQLIEKRLPNRWDLDEAAPNHPVYVIRGGHEVILNSKALALAGIDRDTPSPDGGQITKDLDTGEPTGEFIDNAIALVSHILPPPPSPAEMAGLLTQAVDKMLAAGYTSIRDPGLEPSQMRVYQNVWKKGDLRIRVSMMPSLERSGKASKMSAAEYVQFFSDWGVRDGFGSPMLRIDAIKLALDGGFEGALMRDPYAEGSDFDADFHGIQRVPTEKFTQVVMGLNRAGWRAGTHVAGDKAIDIVLDAYEKADQDKSIKGKRWILEHALLTRPDHIKRIKELGLVISTQDHVYIAASSMIKNWGRERTEAITSIKDLLNADIIVGSGTDWPVVPYNPFIGIYFWTTRDTLSAGQLNDRGQTLTREEALKMQTINNAHITFEENVKGSLEGGKYADLIVIDRDYMKVALPELKDIEVLATMVDGKWVFKSEHFLILE